MNKASSLALASIFLYASLAVTCLYFALCFYDFKTGEFRDGRYSAPKFIFFVVLFCSAVLDIPLFIGCIARGGPTDCEWEDPSYVVFWLFHLVATCGYIYAIITPAVLWSDIIYQKDGMFWNSAYPVDSTKLFFRVAFVLFCANEFTTVVGAVVMQDPSNIESFNSNSIGAITDCITPIVTTIITFGCLWAGIELQRYVVNVGLGGGTRNRVLMQLNLTMFLIAATYMYRSLLVLSLYDPIPQQYKDAMHPIRSSFFLWLLGTRWLPAVVCSFCLVNEMRFKGSASSNSRHSQSAVMRASKDLHASGEGAWRGGNGAGEHTLYQSLLRAVGRGPSNTRGSNSTNNTSNNSHSHRAVGRRTLSATSMESCSTMDSALHETYSMLSSVDFPDSSSETSGTYFLSPSGSPDRVKSEQEALLLGRSQDVLISTRGGNNGSGGGVNSNNKGAEAERIARKHRKGLMQLGQQHNIHNGNNTSGVIPSTHSTSNNTTLNTVYNPAQSTQHNTHTAQSRAHPHTTPSSHYPHNTTHTTYSADTAQPAPSPSSYSPHFLSRAASESSSDADFYQGRYPASRTTSIDHFFTFAAPNLNLSRFGGANGSGSGNSSGVSGVGSVDGGGSSGALPPAMTGVAGSLGSASSIGSNGGIIGGGGRSQAGSLTGPAHIQHTLNANNNNYSHNRNTNGHMDPPTLAPANLDSAELSSKSL